MHDVAYEKCRSREGSAMCRVYSSACMKLGCRWIFKIIKCVIILSNIHRKTLQNNLSIHTAGSDGALYCNIYDGHIFCERKKKVLWQQHDTRYNVIVIKLSLFMICHHKNKQL